MCRGKSEFPGEATTAVAQGVEPSRLFLESPCPLPSRFWQVALEPPGALTAPEQEHLRGCGRCRNHLARVLQAVVLVRPGTQVEAGDLLLRFEG